MKKTLYLAIAALGISTLSGCSTLSGFDASSEFACNAPVGVSCASVSGVYANAKVGNLPSQKVGEEKFRYMTRDGKAVEQENASVKDNNEFDFLASGTVHHEEEKPVEPKFSTTPPAKVITGDAPNTDTPVYIQAQVLRVWFAPWEDAENMLHDQSYVYMTVQKGRWDIEHLSKEVAADSRLSIQKLYR
jgi:conjugal transfer pilus assembly protein TraV